MIDQWPEDIKLLTPAEREAWLSTLEGEWWRLHLALQIVLKEIGSALGLWRRPLYILLNILDWLGRLWRRR